MLHKHGELVPNVIGDLDLDPIGPQSFPQSANASAHFNSISEVATGRDGMF